MESTQQLSPPENSSQTQFPENRSPIKPPKTQSPENRSPIKSPENQSPENRSPIKPPENQSPENQSPIKPPENQSPGNRSPETIAHRPVKGVPALSQPPQPVPMSPAKDGMEGGGGRSEREEEVPVPLPPVMVVKRSNREEIRSVTKLEGGAEGGGGRTRLSSIIRRSRREEMVRRTDLGFRVLGLIFCLVSFSVMAADKTRGWAGDSFDRYKEYRYCISITVIGFVYSGFQAYVQALHLVTGKHVIRHPIRYHLDFLMDQILAYLLLSASSSAATRTEDWVSNWGEDEFTKMASASVGMAFLAFVAFGFSALISGYNLCNGNSY